ncbi:MAG: hypothetical protein IJ565_03115 [Bacilli bacterium]|nr:hypothetical protein [Bacilli bacterium]
MGIKNYISNLANGIKKNIEQDVALTKTHTAATVYRDSKGNIVSNDFDHTPKLDLGNRYLSELEYEPAVAEYKPDFKIEPKSTGNTNTNVSKGNNTSQNQTSIYSDVEFDENGQIKE